MKKMINSTTIAGYIYENKLEQKITGENSKNPGTSYIAGTLDIATDEACVNIVSVHFTYVTPTTTSGKNNATYAVLKNIIDKVYKTIMADGKENATKVSINSAIGLNEFYSDKTGKEELVSAKRNEGGFITVVDTLPSEDMRNTFRTDIVINGTRHIEADEEKNLPEKLVIKGAIFDFRNTLLPVEYSVINPNAISYFESLEASDKNPVFTQVWGRQISEVVVREIREASAFGDDYVRTVTNTRKDFVITGAKADPYEWDDEATITVKELQEAMANRQTYLATIKQRQDEYKASRNTATITSGSTFNF